MLEIKNICVKFAYKNVLNGISLKFQQKKIYSLLGENGAGKSTLAHVICGDLQQTGGEIFLDGKKLFFRSPKDAIKSGIVCVHQRPILSEIITIEENITIGLNKQQFKNFQTMKKDFYAQWLPNCNPKQKLSMLDSKDHFFVSLIAALSKNPKVLILDEPPHLSKEKLQELTQKGLTIIIITHHLQQALNNSDFVILLKEGQTLLQQDSTKITKQEIEQKLFGISSEIPRPSFIKQKDICENQIEHKIGEIGVIPQNTTFKASNPNLSILQLVTSFSPKGKQKELEQRAKKILENAQVDIKLYEKASCLSGGMLQRLVLERELAENPKKLYLFNATHGLDAEATQKLYKKLEQLWHNGTEIIFGKADIF